MVTAKTYKHIRLMQAMISEALNEVLYELKVYLNKIVVSINVTLLHFHVISYFILLSPCFTLLNFKIAAV